MKITINNFGPIHKFEIDLTKNISLIYGKNSIGKSYAMSVVYMFLKSFPVLQKGDNLRSAIGNLVHGYNSEKLTLPKGVNFIITRFLNNTFSETFKRYLKSSYGDLTKVRNQFQDNVACIDIQMQSLSFKFVLWDRNEFHGGIVELSYPIVSMVSEKENFYNTNELNETCYNVLKEFLREIIPYTSSVYYIPAVRSGYYLGLSNLGAIISKINQYQSAVGSHSFLLPNTTVPVSDFYTMLSDTRGFLSSDDYHYKSAVDKIEENILGGLVNIDRESGRIIFQSNKLKGSSDLSQVSSMISEISIITAYLKFIIKDSVTLDDFDGGQNLKFGVFPTLYIEEPEAHLHPEAQVKLMEYFVELANLGLKIIITTHSDFMFSKMVNLLMQGKIASTEVGSYLLEITEFGSVSNKNVMAAESDGIDDFNFLETTENLYNERMEASERYGSKAN